MPTYQYKCRNCDFEFEEEHRISDRNIPVNDPRRYGSCSDENYIYKPCDIHIVPQLSSMMYTMRDSARRHTDDGFKDRMKEIHRTNPGSQLGDWT